MAGRARALSESDERAERGGLPESGSLAAVEPPESFFGSSLAIAEAPKLDIYGFADFSYSAWLERSQWSELYRAEPSFSVGNVNVYLDGSLGPKWRSLVEIRFMYLPNGADAYSSADSELEYTSTLVRDNNEFNRGIEWGGIRIERAWLQFTPSQYLGVRVGQFITPFGIWNTDHGSPVIIGAGRPFVVTSELFPERQTGLEAFGQIYVGESSLSYELTLSNGRGPIQDTTDLDQNKAVGGRLELETPLAGALELGIAAYKGRYSSVTRTLALTPAGDVLQVSITREPAVVYDELSLGADLRWRWGELLLQGELAVNEAAFADEHRRGPADFGAPGALQPDYRRIGGYVLLGYRTPWLGIMPYTIAQHMNFTESDSLPPASGVSLGLNIRPLPNVVFKVDYTTAIFSSPGSLGLGDEAIRFFRSQAAWAF